MPLLLLCMSWIPCLIDESEAEERFEKFSVGRGEAQLVCCMCTYMHVALLWQVVELVCMCMRGFGVLEIVTPEQRLQHNISQHLKYTAQSTLTANKVLFALS